MTFDIKHSSPRDYDMHVLNKIVEFELYILSNPSMKLLHRHMLYELYEDVHTFFMVKS